MTGGAELMREGLIRRVSVCRFLSDALAGVAEVLTGAARAFENLSDSFFLLEADAALRYRGLTGVELGSLTGDPDRYDADAKNEELCEADVDDEDEA